MDVRRGPIMGFKSRAISARVIKLIVSILVIRMMGTNKCLAHSDQKSKWG